MSYGSYDWEPYTVITEDGWFLSLFHITGVKGESRPSEDFKDKPPILLMHGGGGSAMGEVEGGTPGGLAERGYDVWVGNNRGARYSDKNRRDGEWSEKERMNWSWAEMGIYDVPAFIDKVLEVTGKPKVTLIGYSMGTAQIYYGLAKKQDYFAERVNRYVAQATCAVVPESTTYEQTVREFLWYEQNDIHSNIDLANYESGSDQRLKIDNLSMMTTLYYRQIGAEKRF